jgi:hypothetical protein
MPRKKENSPRPDRHKGEAEASVTIHVPKELHKELWDYKKSDAYRYSKIKHFYLDLIRLGWKHFKK